MTSRYPAVANAFGMNSKVDPRPHLQMFTVAYQYVEPATGLASVTVDSP